MPCQEIIYDSSHLPNQLSNESFHFVVSKSDPSHVVPKLLQFLMFFIGIQKVVWELLNVNSKRLFQPYLVIRQLVKVKYFLSERKYSLNLASGLVCFSTHAMYSFGQYIFSTMPHSTRQTMSKLNIRHMWFLIRSRNCSFILFLALCPKQLDLCELDQLAHLSTDLKPMAGPGRREGGRWKRHQGISSAAISICWCTLMTMAMTFHKQSLYQIPCFHHSNL